MKLVDFVALFNRNKGCFNSFIVIRSNPKPDSPSYYFRNVDRLNYIFKHIWQFSKLPMSTYESRFLQYLPDCLSQIKVKPTTTDSEVSAYIQTYFLSKFQ